MIASKPIEIATVASGSAFAAPALVDGRVPSGRLPEPNLYFPDEFEIEFRSTGGSPVIAGPVIVDVWKLDLETNTEEILNQVELSATDLDVSSLDDNLPPIFVAGNTRAISLRSGTIGGGGGVVASVVWRSRVT